MIQVKRVYEPAEAKEGTRILVDRLWPRGMTKKALRLDSWDKDVAPSSELRKWFNHDPARWDEFRRRYFAELDNNATAWRPLTELARSGNVILLFSARVRKHNNAEALKDYLEAKLER